MLIGRGSYGAVRIHNSMAYKKFNKLSHCIQEYAALHMLEPCHYTVKARKINFRKIEIAMDLYECSLRDWLQKEHRTSSKDQVFRQILRGCIELHSRGLAHGDLKPGNILVNQNPLEIVLGDLGFVAKAKYSKCSRTAPAYRDPQIIPSTAHDIFSLAIIFLEMYYRVSFGRRNDYHRLQKFIGRQVTNPNHSAILLAMVNPVHQERPSATDILAYLYPEDQYLNYTASLEIPVYRPSLRKYNLEIKELMKELASRYKINRSNQGYQAVTYYIEHSKLKPAYYHFYARVMIMILSSIFGKSGYSTDQVLQTSPGCQFSDLEEALAQLLESTKVMSIIYY